MAGPREAALAAASFFGFDFLEDSFLGTLFGVLTE